MSPRNSRIASRRLWLGVLLSVAVVVAIVFCLPEGQFLCSPSSDMAGQLAAERSFATDNILAGHFPLWNPYTYAGEPFLGDFQSAELYPPNVIFLFLPLARAVNLSFLLHLLLLGWGIGIWVVRRGGHPLAGTLAAIALMLCGPVFLRLFSGQIANICTIAWAPWMFCALEASWRGRPLRPLLLAAATVCLQILGGHPQYVVYLAVAAAIHATVYSVLDPGVRRRAVPSVALAYLGGAALAAAQLLPGLAATLEGVRQGALAFNFSSKYSFPPENLLTLIAPGVFGNVSDASYWGRGLLWEMSAFIGVTTLALAIVAFFSAVNVRRARADWLIAAVLFVFALGSHTPLFSLLYNYVPFFGQFRTMAKFIFPTVLFVILAGGAGADALIRSRPIPRLLAIGFGLGGLAAIGLGVSIYCDPSLLQHIWTIIQESHESFLPSTQAADHQFFQNSGQLAGHSLINAGALLAVVGGALGLARRHPAWRWLPLVLLPIEMFYFAYGNLGSSTLADLDPPSYIKYIDAHPGDYRVLNFANLNNGYFLHAPDLWGNNPFVLKRYAEFIAFTQDFDLARGGGQNMFFTKLPKPFALLRFRFAFIPKNFPNNLVEFSPSLPHALLVSNYQVLSGRDAIFAEFNNSGFNPRKTVLLETEPSPRPLPDSPPGTVQLSELNSDTLEITVDTPAPALLLITDLYSRDWHAHPLPGSVQTHYDILPADYIVRAIPLAAGHHHFVVEYAPASFRLGLIISGVTWLAWAALLAISLRRE